jgi:hypothetical protein
MREIQAGDFVRIVSSNYLTVEANTGEAYAVDRVAQVENRRPLYEVVVPNVFDEPTIPFWEDELELVQVSEL